MSGREQILFLAAAWYGYKWFQKNKPELLTVKETSKPAVPPQELPPLKDQHGHKEPTTNKQCRQICSKHYDTTWQWTSWFNCKKICKDHLGSYPEGTDGTWWSSL